MSCNQSKFGRQTDCSPLQLNGQNCLLCNWIKNVICVFVVLVFCRVFFNLNYVFFYLLISRCIDVEYNFVNYFLSVVDSVCFSVLPFNGINSLADNFRSSMSCLFDINFLFCFFKFWYLCVDI